MKDDIHRFLDGDLPPEDLDAAGREDAAAWDRLLDTFRVEQPAGGAPPWLEQRVMAEIEALPARGLASRLLDWLVRPHPVRVPPLAVGLAAAAVAVVVLIPEQERMVDTASPGGAVVAAAAQAPIVYVQFKLEAPGATSVAIAGDFTGWNPSHELQDPDGDGVWTGRVPVGPGVHTYMFVIDGSEWITDPNANRYQDDGFGSRNAVLAVAPPKA